jgi:hypothetical protein
MSAGQKLAQGSANVAVSAPAQLAKGLFGKIKKAGSAMKKGYKGEDVDYWEEFLDENGITVDEYMMVVEDAYENGDEEMIEDLLQLDEARPRLTKSSAIRWQAGGPQLARLLPSMVRRLSEMPLSEVLMFRRRRPPAAEPLPMKL